MAPKSRFKRVSPERKHLLISKINPLKILNIQLALISKSNPLGIIFYSSFKCTAFASIFYFIFEESMNVLDLSSSSQLWIYLLLLLVVALTTVHRGFLPVLNMKLQFVSRTTDSRMREKETKLLLLFNVEIHFLFHDTQRFEVRTKAFRPMTSNLLKLFFGLDVMSVALPITNRKRPLVNSPRIIWFTEW